MAEAVIVEAVRSPVGKRNGGLSGVHPGELSAQVLNGLAQRAGIDPEIVDDVIWGCVMQAGEQALDIARTAVLAAGWPESVPGVTVDRQCGSSQQSVHFAAAGVVAGHYDVVIAGGVESMSRTPMGASLANGGHPYPEAFRSRFGVTAPFGGPTSSGMLTLHCPPDHVYGLSDFLRAKGAAAVSVAEIGYLFTQDNPLFAKLEAALNS